MGVARVRLTFLPGNAEFRARVGDLRAAAEPLIKDALMDARRLESKGDRASWERANVILRRIQNVSSSDDWTQPYYERTRER